MDEDIRRTIGDSNLLCFHLNSFEDERGLTLTANENNHVARGCIRLGQVLNLPSLWPMKTAGLGTRASRPQYAGKMPAFPLITCKPPPPMILLSPKRLSSDAPGVGLFDTHNSAAGSLTLNRSLVIEAAEL